MELWKIKAVLVDASWLLARSFHSPVGMGLSITLENGTEVATGDIYGFLTALVQIRQCFRSAVIFICTDQKGGDYIKKEGMKGYKEGRKSAAGMFDKMDECLAAASLIDSCFVVSASRREADELIVSMAKILVSKGQKAVAFAVDKDVRQALGYLDFMFSKFLKGRPGDKMSAEELWKKTGVRPRAYALYQAIVGDKCDGIPGIFRMVKKDAAEIANAFVGVEALKEGKDQDLSRQAHRSLARVRESIDMVERNFSMTNMGGVPEEEIKIRKIEGGRDVVKKYRLSTFDRFLESSLSKRGE